MRWVAVTLLAAVLLAAGSNALDLEEPTLQGTCEAMFREAEEAVSDEYVHDTIEQLVATFCPNEDTNLGIELTPEGCTEFLYEAVDHILEHLHELVHGCDAFAPATTDNLLAQFTATMKPIMVSAAGAVATEQAVIADLLKTSTDAFDADMNTILAFNEDNGEKTCEYCKFAVTEVRKWVADPSNQKLVIDYAKSGCHVIGGDMAETCSQLVEQYAPLSFALAMDYLRPTKLCTQLGYCSNASPPPAIVLGQARVHDASEHILNRMAAAVKDA